MNSSAFSYLNFIHFSQLNLWDFKRYIAKVVSSKYPIVKLATLINEENKKIKPFDFPEEKFEILGVNNKTGLFDAYIEDGNKINQPYKIVENGFLAYNPYRINVGSIGLKTKDQKYKYISPAYVVFSCKKDLLPEFLYILFRTDKFNELIRENTTGSVRQTLSFSSMGQIQIPLPSLEKQKEIVDRYNAKIKLAEEQEKKAQNLEEMIEQYICSELKIVNTSPKVSNEFKISFVNYKDLSRWGVEFLKNNLSSKDFLKSLVYPMKKLGTLVAINPDNDFSKLDENLEMTFLPMASISDKFGEIVYAEKGKNGDSNGYTKFKEGDLLWAKITPCMQNGKSAIAKNLINNRGYGSTEFYVIRNKNENELYFDYIYHLLRTKIIRETATKYFTGSSGQQRVPKSFLENLSIPLPDFYKQKQISDELYKIKHKIKELTYTAEQNRQLAQEEFEKELFE